MDTKVVHFQPGLLLRGYQMCLLVFQKSFSFLNLLKFQFTQFQVEPRLYHATQPKLPNIFISLHLRDAVFFTDPGPRVYHRVNSSLKKVYVCMYAVNKWQEDRPRVPAPSFPPSMRSNDAHKISAKIPFLSLVLLSSVSLLKEDWH